jgi:hypothetical protein
MTDDEFVQSNRGIRGFLAFLIFMLALAVGVEAKSFGWFWITLMAGCVLRLLPVAGMLDRLDPKDVSQSQQMIKKKPV